MPSSWLPVLHLHSPSLFPGGKWRAGIRIQLALFLARPGKCCLFFLPFYDQSETDPFPGPVPLLSFTGSPLFPGVSQEVGV